MDCARAVSACEELPQLPGTTEYVHVRQHVCDTRWRTGSRSAPQVRASDPEIQVRTEWAPLLGRANVSLLRPEVEAAADYAGSDLFLMDGLFTRVECLQLIDAAESIGFGRTSYPKQYRGNLRLITVDQSLSDAVWQRMRGLVPATVQDEGAEWRACGLNECWRLAKYLPGDQFGAHVDACFERDEDERSMFTVNVYMNDVAHGGATRFYSGTREDTETPVLSVQPEAGLAVIFRQPPEEQLLHDGEELAGGTKYLFRSDVMYRLQPKSEAAEAALDAAMQNAMKSFGA